MKSLHSIILPVICTAFILSTGCGGAGSSTTTTTSSTGTTNSMTTSPSNQNGKSSDTSANAAATTPHLLVITAPSVVFGDPGSNCSLNGICQNAGGGITPTNINALFIPGTAPGTNIFLMSFNYQDLLKNQPKQALSFYNNGPVQTYSFTSIYNINQLPGGPFPSETIQPNLPGTIQLIPQPVPGTQSANVIATVVVTFLVTP